MLIVRGDAADPPVSTLEMADADLVIAVDGSGGRAVKWREGSTHDVVVGVVGAPSSKPEDAPGWDRPFPWWAWILIAAIGFFYVAASGGLAWLW